MLATLVLSQVVFSSIPLILFVLLTIGVLVFSLAAALVIGLLGALLFTVFCVGIGLFFLLPTLFVTTFLAVSVWLWVWGAYLVISWFGTRDTKQLTNLSSDWASQFLGRPGTKSDLHNEHVQKQESASVEPLGVNSDLPKQPEFKPEATEKEATDLEKANESVGDFRKQSNAGNAISVAG